MFTQSCFIRKNTPELRKKLEELGYKSSPFSGINEYLCVKEYFVIKFDGEGWYKAKTEHRCFSTSKHYYNEKENGIDCGENEELFLAIAALRDDNDYMQWFVTEVDQSWVNQNALIPKGTFYQCFTDSYYPTEWKGHEEFCSSIVPAHKATVEELIEHFTK